MKDYLATLVRETPTPLHGRNRAREYLQARILGALQQAALTTWQEPVRARLQEADWSQAVANVRPFLESSTEANLLTPDTLLGLLQPA